MNPPKSLKEFKAQQKEKRKSLSKPIENLISDLKFNPAKFLSYTLSNGILVGCL